MKSLKSEKRRHFYERQKKKKKLGKIQREKNIGGAVLCCTVLQGFFYSTKTRQFSIVLNLFFSITAFGTKHESGV